MSSRLAYRSNTDIDEGEAEKLWKILQMAITQIFGSNESKLSFEELYRSGYLLVLHKHGKKLYNGLDGEIRKNLDKIRKKLVLLDDLKFLSELVAKWNFYILKINMIKDILMYMDRNFVATVGYPPVYDLGLKLFHECIVKDSHYGQRITDLVLLEIKKDRDGKSINKATIRDILLMLVTVGIDSRVVYQTEFEEKFLKQTKAYYKAEAARNIDENSCADYLRKVEMRLKEEKSRCKTYIDTSTEVELMRLLNNELIAVHCDQLIGGKVGCQYLFEEHEIDVLARMSRLFSKINGALEKVSIEFAEFVERDGNSLTEKFKTDKEGVKLIEMLITKQKKYETIVNKSFNKDRLFKKALTKSFEKVVNKNHSTAHFLCLFIDDVMKNKAKNRAKYEDINILEQTLSDALVIFRHLHERDVFESYYKQLLAKRLLAKKKDFTRNIAFEAEKLMIKLLKAEIGPEFTNKLEKMIKDIDHSSEENKDFNQRWLAAKKIPKTINNFEVTILTSEMWPYSTKAITLQQKSSILLNHHLIKQANAWYKEKYEKRKLIWLFSLGNVELDYALGSKVYSLIVTTYQMCILKLFNDCDSLKYTQIAESLKIPVDELKRHLISLAAPRYKILNKDPKGRNVSEVDIFTINSEFYSKQDLIKIPLVSSRSHKGAGLLNKVDLVPANVKEDRKQLIEASVVRIMKTRKKIRHNELIAEVIKHLEKRFRPSPGLIKQRIESLIEREFIERDEEEMRLYRYMD